MSWRPPPRWLGSQHVELERCGSTNDEAGRLARAGARHGTIVTALAQDAGRGRLGRAWSSPPGAGLYLSAIVRPSLALPAVPPMTLAIGIGLCEAVRQLGVAATLKWPNDVLVGDRKLAGVLVESHSQGNRLEAVIVGIGVNLAPVAAALPPELAGHSTSLADALGVAAAALDRRAFLTAVLIEVERWIDAYVAGGLAAVRAPWQARMAPGLRGRGELDGDLIEGELVGLDEDGALLLADAAGTRHRFRAGEVELIRPGMAPPADPR
jgi:BirA family biotin operon repressor/biotin-[acetyl-CoA-carboxylase] ligase